jgi:endonuclease YncB( thermonuclease family)
MVHRDFGLSGARAAAYRHATMRRVLTVVALGGLTAFAVLNEGACTSQERIAGHPSFIDGDSFEIGSVGVRLFGVDAPEGRQSCTRDGRDWGCGDAAARELRRLVGSREVDCVQRDEDGYGRIVAVCRVGSTDLGEAIVRAGFATAYRRYSNDYVDEEREARSAKRGIWAGEFTPPEEYRRDERAEAPAQRSDPAPAPRGRRDGCNIKGNIRQSSGDRIYHVPGSSSYDETRIDESSGERWFCTEAEAQRAGWRAPRGR